LQYVHNPKGNDTIQDLDIVSYAGNVSIVEEMEGLKFNISAKSFYQTNSEKAYELYKITREYANLRKEDVELYIGYYKKIRNGCVEVKYKQSISDGGISYGRYYPVVMGIKPAVYQTRSIRSELFSENELDIDAVSCHPVIIQNICKELDIKCPYLDIYVSNKQTILNCINIDQHDVDYYNHKNDENYTIDGMKKKIINTSIYKQNKSSFKDFVVDPKKVLYSKNSLADFFIDELLRNRKIIITNPKYSDIINAYEPLFKKKNKGKIYNDGSQYAVVIQTIESEYILDAIKYFKENNIDVTTYEYDGFQVRKNNDETLSEFRIRVDELLNNYNSKLKYCIKDFSKKFSSIEGFKYRTDIEIEHDLKKIDNTIIPVDVDIDDIGVKNDEEACLKFIYCHRHIVSCCGELYLFDKSTLKWINSENSIDSIYSIFCLYEKELNLLKYNKNDDCYTQSEISYGTTLKYQKILFEKLKQKNIDNNWYNESIDKSNGMVLFKNGYYNINEKYFYKKDDILDDESELQKCAEYRFFNSTGYNYMVPDESYLKKACEVFMDIQLTSEERDYYLSLISRSAFGEKLKHFVFVIGTGNTGKSIFNAILRKTFGEYVGEFSLDNFSSSRKASDEGQLNRWAFLLKNKRICISAEITSATLSAGTIKKMSSGGSDMIQGRFHGKNETSFYYNPLHIGCINDIKGIDGFDKASSNRVVIFEYDKIFTLDDSLVNNINVFKERVEYKGYSDMDIYKNAFFQLCIRNHSVKECPKIISNRNEIFFGSEADHVGSFLESFEFCAIDNSNRKSSFLSNAEITKWMNSVGMKMSLICFKKILKSSPGYVANGCNDTTFNNLRGVCGLRKKMDECYLSN
jgi:hypothetical protein